MKRNESPVDRIIRVLVGIALIVLGLFGVVSGWLLWAFYIIGAVLLLTGIAGFCPLYALLKLNTSRK